MQLPNKYEDERGNSASVDDTVKTGNAEVVFRETGSSIEIGSGSNVAGARFTLGKNSRIKIGDKCKFSGEIFVGAYSTVTIGDSLQVTGNMYIRAVEQTAVIIGQDCLVAKDVVIRTTDGHVIYNRYDRKRINAASDVIIGDHVWIADRSVILKGVRIGNSSVIALGSIVTKNVPSNVIVAGSPAKVVRRDIVWEHNPKVVSEQYYADPSDAPALRTTEKP